MLANIALSFATLASLAAAESHMVWVGQGGLTFQPDTINATIGDTVEFHFASNGHDVAQGPFDDPCNPSDNGFYSGSVTTDDVFIVTIEDTRPQWIYCAVAQHCANGMVAVINPPSTGPNTLDAYRQAASEAGAGVAPPEMRGGELGEHGGDSTPSGTWGYPSGTATPDAAPALLAQESIVLSIFLGSLAVVGGWFGLL